MSKETKTEGSEGSEDSVAAFLDSLSPADADSVRDILTKMSRREESEQRVYKEILDERGNLFDIVRLQ